MGFDVFVGLQSGAGHDSRSGTWVFLVYSGVCQPLELDSWNSPKGIRTKILLEGMAEPIWMREAFNDAYPPVFPEFFFGFKKTKHPPWIPVKSEELDGHIVGDYQQLWMNKDSTKTCCCFLALDISERSCEQDLASLLYVGGCTSQVYIYINIYYYLYISIYIYIERAFYHWHGWNVATPLPFYKNESVWYFLGLRWAVKEGLPSGNFVARLF